MVLQDEIYRRDQPLDLPKKDLKQHRHKGKTVLLVEDNLVVQIIHEGMLTKLGCQVEIASTAEDALALVENTYDLILLDIGLPGMSGVEAASRFRAHPKHKHTPIIAVTTDREQCYVDGRLHFEFAEIIQKPVGIEKFKELID